MIKIDVKWKGQNFRIAPTHEIYKVLEDRNISLSELSAKLEDASKNGGRSVPYAHIAELCCEALLSAGVETTPDEVRREIFNGFSYGDLVGGLILGYFGVGPQEPPEEEPGNVAAG